MLLAEKQQLVERLQQEPGPHERHQIERLLADIDEALNFLDQAQLPRSGRPANARRPSGREV